MNTEAWVKLVAEPEQRFCTERELAELLGWDSGQCVRRAVHRGELPPPIRLGRWNVYVVGVVRDYVVERARVLARRIVNL